MHLNPYRRGCDGLAKSPRTFGPVSDQDGDIPGGEAAERAPLYAVGEPGDFRGLLGEISEVTGRRPRAVGGDFRLSTGSV